MQDGPKASTTVLSKREQEDQSQGRCANRSRGQSDIGPQAKECEQPLEARKVKKQIPSQASRRNTVLPTFDFSSVIPTLDF